MYYNDNDKAVCEWLKELIKNKLLPNGDVDDRDIRDVCADDVRGYSQCHFFAGIGGWALAIRWAGFEDARGIWTGSCPCQPFSLAGSMQGAQDKRHLWPEFYRLIRECAPAVVFGEQVAGPLGREWLAGVRSDLEALGYAVGAADLCAAGVGAPHRRQRLYWVADRTISQLLGGMGDSKHYGWLGYKPGDSAQSSGVVEGRVLESERPSCRCPAGWEPYEVVRFKDGKCRRIEPGTFPLADGFPERVGLLRGYGNAIVPQLAAEFIQAWAEAAKDLIGWRNSHA